MRHASLAHPIYRAFSFHVARCVGRAADAVFEIRKSGIDDTARNGDSEIWEELVFLERSH